MMKSSVLLTLVALAIGCAVVIIQPKLTTLQAEPNPDLGRFSRAQLKHDCAPWDSPAITLLLRNPKAEYPRIRFSSFSDKGATEGSYDLRIERNSLRDHF